MSAGRLLLVDDEADLRAIARLALERIGGYEVVPACGGDDALVAAAAGPFDGVLCDVQMPGLDGPAVARALWEGPLGPDVPVVFITASAAASDHARLRALGARGVIAKPFDPMTLAEQVAALISPS